LRKTEKIESVAELKQRIQENTVSVTTQYVGITVEEVTTLRRNLREAGVIFKVYKNTLAKRVLDELDLSEAEKFIEGPTAWAFSNDPVAPAKILKEFGKSVKAISINGGIFEGKVVSQQEMLNLASLPSREVLLGQVVGTIAAPLRNFVGALSGVPRNLVNVLDQIQKEKEKSAAA